MTDQITLGVAFLAGILSFFAPCILPVIPAYISHLSGTSLDKLEEKKSKKLQKKVFLNSVFFVLGFSVVFILLGLFIGFLSEQVLGFRIYLGYIGGSIIIFFGLQTLGLVEVPFFLREHKIRANPKNKIQYLRSSILGSSFAIGWTPCIGPILTLILILAGTSESAAFGAGLLTIYSLGLGIPFLITGLFTSQISHWIKNANKHFQVINIISGVLLIGLGILIFTDQFARAVSLIAQVFKIPFYG